MNDRILELKEIRVAARGRRQAGMLLTRLLHDQRQSEARTQATGANDPIKHVTGSSSLDRAIASTREMIRYLDEMLVDPSPHEKNGSGSANGNSRCEVNVKATPAPLETTPTT